MSLRTLQRRLSDDNTTYKQVLDDTRRELAERFVRDDSLTLNEITYLLGFSEISSFSRSFKRWTGLAPSVYRRNIDKAPEEPA
jgi:AraC-like DNA-binding protein